MMKLKVGNIIKIVGSVTMQNLESGQKYRVNRIATYRGNKFYFFTEEWGGRELVGQCASYVDLLIDRENSNRIEIV